MDTAAPEPRTAGRRVKANAAETRSILFTPGNYLPLAVGLLVFFGAAVTCYAGAELAELFVDTFYEFTPLDDVLIYTGLGLSLFLLCAPVGFGYVRMCAQLCTPAAGTLAVRDVFHYFTSWKRLARAWWMTLLFLAGLALPVGIVTVALRASWGLYAASPGTLTLTFFILSVPLAAALAVLLLYLAGLYSLSLAFAVGDETLSLPGALALGFRYGRRNLAVLFAFAWHVLWWLFISAVTVGVAFILYAAHHITIAYFRLSMALSSKGTE